MKTGIELIAAERERQVTQEYWTADHDSKHRHSELAKAAECYSRRARGDFSNDLDMLWPWDRMWWKPSRDPVRNLVKAGALIAAEIDRIQRPAKLREQFTEVEEGKNEG